MFFQNKKFQSKPDTMEVMVGVFLLLSSVAAQPAAPLVSAEARARITLPLDSKGFSMVLSSQQPRLEDVAEPNLVGAFGVGFDTYNPKETDIFNANGNIYDRPQREVSLHWNGVELANKLSPVEIKSINPQEFRVAVTSVLGGSNVSVFIGRTAVYDKHFVPFLKPLADAWHVAGAGGSVSAKAGRAAKVEQVKKVKVFEDQLNDAGRHKFSQIVQLPSDVSKVGRIVATLKLGATPKGIDPWDRYATLYLKDDAGQRFEVVRCITPYRKGWTWTTDVTHLLPLLQGSKEFTWECETWGEGWLISFDLDYFDGPLKLRPSEVKPLWQDSYELGTGKPLPKPVTYSLGKVKKAEVFTIVTGHGMSPNSDNAAEFLPLWRKLMVNDKVYQNNLWKEDNYLNPCRPQGGTWKFDRAGWAPGSVVEPWRVDVTKDLTPSTKFGYEIQPYVNKTPADGNPARHIIDSVLVLFN